VGGRGRDGWVVASTVWAWTSLPNGGSAPTFGVTLSLLENRGAAFGIGGSYPVLVLLVAVAVTVALALWLARSAFRLQRLGLAVALGGGLGNFSCVWPTARSSTGSTLRPTRRHSTSPTSPSEVACSSSSPTPSCAASEPETLSRPESFVDRDVDGRAPGFPDSKRMLATRPALLEDIMFTRTTGAVQPAAAPSTRLVRSVGLGPAPGSSRRW